MLKKMIMKQHISLLSDINFKKSSITFGGIFLFGILFGYVLFPMLLKTMIGRVGNILSFKSFIDDFMKFCILENWFKAWFRNT